ncbi:hypothetical protein DM01DRAFT_1301754 [Hesseltinella vesiculosa]|uniref:Beach-domain-containing protein n=1 Tax=Hesseltinella vesiculosa TaxID=101127 RepID=A0A1X2GQG6_9FUNG|nr:hypothetical protein DM01DRAFT_1301754 [Hesseltinella vesiculosa]
MGLLSRQFLAALKKIPEQGTRAETSQVLMYHLRSKSRLFYLARTLQILANGPVGYLNMMLQQRIPSVITKIFRSFIDLPCNDDSQEEQSESSTKDEDEDEDDDDLISQEEASDTIINILLCFVRDPALVRRLTVDDTFYTMLRLVTAKPADTDLALTSPYFYWKAKAVFVLTSVQADIDTVQYIHSRRFIEVMGQVWKELGSSRQRVGARIHASISLELDLIKYLAKISVDTGSFGLFDEIQSANLYQTLSWILLNSLQDEDCLEYKSHMVQALTDLCFIGKGFGSPSMTDGLPHQHADFVFPKPSAADEEGTLVRNLATFQLLQQMLLFTPPTSDADAAATKSMPPTLRVNLFHAVRSVLTRNRANYFYLERTNILPLLIESMDIFDTHVQNGIMDLLAYVMTNLNFVPLKELAVLCLHLQNTANGKLVPLICQRIAQLVRQSTKLQPVFQQSGMINMMGLLVSKITDALNQERDALDSQEGVDRPAFVQNCLENFDIIIDCLIALIEDPSNAVAFRKSYTGNVFDLLHHKQTQVGTLQLFEALSQHGGSDPSGSEVSYAFSRMMEAIQAIPRTALDCRLAILNSIKRILLSHPSTKEVLRESGGYVTLVSMIVSLENAFTTDVERFAPDHDPQLLLDLLAKIIDVLMESMRDNKINSMFFTRHIGYSALEDALVLTGAFDPLEEGSTVTAQVFGMLFGYMVQDASMSTLFLGTRGQSLVDTGAIDPANLPSQVESALNHPHVMIAFPEMATVLFHLQRRCQSYTLTPSTLGRAVLVGLFTLSRANRINQISLNRSGLVLEYLHSLFPHSQGKHDLVTVLNKNDQQLLLETTTKLLTMGVGNKELQYLFQCFGTDGQLLSMQDPLMTTLMDMTLQAMTKSRWPNFIHFDLSTTRPGRLPPSLDFPTLSDFPPGSQGYTMATWFHIERWEEKLNHDLVLWSLFDGQRLVFQVYIEGSSGHLCAYSINSKHISRFENMAFKPGYWYHLALVHGRSRLGHSLSTMTMILNGVWMEQVRCGYLSAPPSPGTFRLIFGGAARPSANIIAASTSTPPPSSVPIAWNMGPTYVFADTLELDVIHLYFYMGARYQSLYLDSLRQFQTYDASTALFLHLENHSRKRRDLQRGLLSGVMRGATPVQPTHAKAILAIAAPHALLHGTDTGLLLTGLDQDTLLYTTSSEMHRVVLNGALAKIQQAVVNTASFGFLVGRPSIAYPFGLDMACWKVGGFALGLNFISRADTSAMLYKSMQVLIEIVQYSWRNSEDMERRRGYEILANMLKHKRDLITVEFLNLLLKFVGKNSASPDQSVISNPFAYRSVILNFEVWKKTKIEVQRVHLEQFIVFMQTSVHRQFNVRRLVKVHLVKKMLLAFRMNIYAKELIPQVVQALKSVTLVNWTTESIRALATFVASTASPSNDNVKPKTSAKRSRLPLSITTNAVVSDTIASDKPWITDAQTWSLEHSSTSVYMCNIVMEMLHDILCQPDQPEFVHKLTSTVTSKWPLLFFAPGTDPYTVVLASRILLHLLHVQGSSYMNKFGVSADGFLVLERLLPYFWNVAPVYEVFTLFFLGIDVARYPLKEGYDLARLQAFIDQQPTSGSRTSPIPAVWPMISALLIEFAKQALLTSPDESENTSADALNQLVLMYGELYKSRQDVQVICNRQEWADRLVELVFRAVIQEPYMTLEGELQSKEAAVDFDDAVPTPTTTGTTSIGQLFSPMDVRSPYDEPGTPTGSIEPASIIKRGGATSLATKTSPLVNKKSDAMITKLRSASWKQNATMNDVKPLTSPAMETVLQIIVDMNLCGILDPAYKHLTILYMFLDAYPPSTLDAQLKFESFLLTHISQNLKQTLQLESQVLQNNVIVTNVSKFCQVAADAVLQGRFINGAEQTYDLLATVLETLQRLEEEKVRGPLPDQIITSLYRSFNRMVLLKVSDLEQVDMPVDQIAAFLNYCIHHQKIILNPRNKDQDFLLCFCYHLYHFLMAHDHSLRTDALNIWKLLILQKQDAIAAAFKAIPSGDELMDGFYQMLEMDNVSFFTWVESRKVDLNLLFKEHIYRTWEAIIVQEHKSSKETWKSHQVRRANKLKKLQKRLAKDDAIFEEYLSKTSVWSQSIQEMELGRFTRALQDNDMHDGFMCTEWARMNEELVRERAIWGPRQQEADGRSTWVLDFTEGRIRTRRKIRRLEENKGAGAIYQPKHSSGQDKDNDQEKDEDSGKAPTSQNPEGLTDKMVELTDEEVTSDVSSTDRFSSNDSEDVDSNIDPSDRDDDAITYDENKNHKVLRLLEPGDMVIEVYNVSQIEGLDAREGLLLLCKQHIYLIDNFFQRANGEVVEIWDVPKHERDEYLLLLAKAAGMETEHPLMTSGDVHACRKWASIDLREVFKRRFLFRDVALELFFSDGQNALITVGKAERDDLFNKLANRVTTSSDDSKTGSILGNADKESTTFGSAFRFVGIFGNSTLQDLTQQWQRREITNFQYLMYLNAIAGRSYNDLTQYPVFPWILADYTSKQLDLMDPSSYRDLTKPMGAQTLERRDEFADRYRQWGETNDPAPAFHYGTHYSSAMIVCSFLIRLEPFTQHYLKLQGGTFDHADRLFDSIGKAWESASEKNMGDVRELIPEFFCLPEFLENVNKFNFGTKQGTGESIDSVSLPTWASNDPKIFIQLHREALESEYVSSHLHHWIDLIFGHKQQGKAAIDALNVFHHVSYEGAVDLDAITDVVEKTATIGIINNFGQTPRQLFKKAHPTRIAPSTDPMMLGFYPLRQHVKKLIQSVYPLRDIRVQVGSIEVLNERLLVGAVQHAFMPPDGNFYVQWGFTDNSLRLYQTDSGKLHHIYENLHQGFISTVCFPDSRTMVTGGTDHAVCLWQIGRDKQINFHLDMVFRGHDDVVLSVAVSRSYSIIATGSQDKTVILWDLNRKNYVRSLVGHEAPVHLVTVDDSTGDILTCAGNVLRIWNVNGDLYLSKVICPSSEKILSCLVYDPKPNEWTGRDLIITGHQNGVVKFWQKEVVYDEQTDENRWILNLVYQLQHFNRVDTAYDASDIVALYLTDKRTLLTGNRHGQVYSFVLPDTTEAVHYVKEERAKECTGCKKSFSVLERKTFCRTCGGAYCNSCMGHVVNIQVPDKAARFCRCCQDILLDEK